MSAISPCLFHDRYITNRFGKSTLFSLAAFFVIAGCGDHSEIIEAPKPRPVRVLPLVKTHPPNAALVTASVGSWKKEDIGFEVNGRVEFVAEPNTEIEGRVIDEDGNIVLEGTPIGRIENDRYQLQVEKAEAMVRQAENQLLAAQIEFDDVIRAQIEAARASQNLAKIQYERSLSLLEKRAGSESDVDRDRANYENTAAQVEQLGATKKAKGAEIEALNSALAQAKQGLQDAKRDLADCTLYSSFRGKISVVSVVPGSVVTSGQPVATVEMMDPIKVEMEVSAEESRRLRKAERLPVIVTLPDGSQLTEDGFLYLIDPVADPLTRTFTITLLVLNEKVSRAADDDITATTDQTWKLNFQFLPGAEEGMLFVADNSLLKDAEGDYLWKVTNVTSDSPFPADGKLKVKKMRVTRGPRKLPFLGNWLFQQVLVDDPEFDPEKHMVAGELFVDGKPEEWNGDTIQLDSGGQWRLRPGDLVKVDMSGSNAEKGFFVPMDAIVREGSESHLFVVDESGDQTKARRIQVELVNSSEGRSTSGMRQIMPTTGEDFENLKYITEGAHYLFDGESIRVIAAEVSE